MYLYNEDYEKYVYVCVDIATVFGRGVYIVGITNSNQSYHYLDTVNSMHKV